MKTKLAIVWALAFALRTASADVSEQMLRRLNHMTPEQAVATQSGWEIPGQYVTCKGTLPIRRGEVPVLLCQSGPGANVTTARAIFWQEGGRWRTQPYPAGGSGQRRALSGRSRRARNSWSS